MKANKPKATGRRLVFSTQGLRVAAAAALLPPSNREHGALAVHHIASATAASGRDPQHARVTHAGSHRRGGSTSRGCWLSTKSF